MQMTVRAFNILFFSDTRTVGLFLLQIYFFSAPRLIWASDRLQNATYGAGSGVGFSSRVSAARRSKSVASGVDS